MNQAPHVTAVILCFLCLSACGQQRHRIEFCAIEAGRFDKESMVIDLEHRRILGSDTSYELKTVELPFAKGFVRPFPFVLPLRPLKDMPTHWEIQGYEFTLSDRTAHESGWVLINGRAMNRQGIPGYMGDSSVLYSPQSGAVALQLSGPRATTDLFFCGTEQVRGESF